MARRLDPENPNEWEATLLKRHTKERELRGPGCEHSEIAVEAYWEYHCATGQVEYVYERLKIAWDVNGVRPAYSISARAVLHYAEIIGVAPW